MRANDNVTREHIERLESQLDAADIETEEWKQAYLTLRVDYDAMVKDRTYCP